jgi:hypothetical protein
MEAPPLPLLLECGLVQQFGLVVKETGPAAADCHDQTVMVVNPVVNGQLPATDQVEAVQR